MQKERYSKEVFENCTSLLHSVESKIKLFLTICFHLFSIYSLNRSWAPVVCHTQFKERRKCQWRNKGPLLPSILSLGRWSIKEPWKCQAVGSESDCPFLRSTSMMFFPEIIQSKKREQKYSLLSACYLPVTGRNASCSISFLTLANSYGADVRTLVL